MTEKLGARWLVFLGFLLTGCGQQEELIQQPSVKQETMETSQNLSEEELMRNDTQLGQDDVEAIIALYDQMKQAMINVDMEKLDAILPDDFVAVHLSGRRQTKEEWLADIDRGQMVYHDFYTSRYHLREKGGTIILNIEQNIHATIYGVEGTWSVPGERLFQKKDGQWQLVG